MPTLPTLTAAFVLAAPCGALPIDGPLAPAAVRANLDPDGARDFDALRRVFEERNPGYRLRFSAATTTVAAADASRVVFLQRGETVARVTHGDRQVETPVRVGDLFALRPGAALETDAPVDLLLFTVPQPFTDAVPPVIRPDFDERLTDRPGGCATDPGAYRRLLLTWDPARGPYVHHGLNCHRVRIDDSFTHYHPVEGGFDEFYLVQEAPPGATLLTSRVTARLGRELEDASSLPMLGRDELDGVLHQHELRAGDLILLPRGLTHRGFGGAVVQVIAVPGFRPGAELPMDDALRALNRRLDADLPTHR